MEPAATLLVVTSCLAPRVEETDGTSVDGSTVCRSRGSYASLASKKTPGSAESPAS